MNWFFKRNEHEITASEMQEFVKSAQETALMYEKMCGKHKQPNSYIFPYYDGRIYLSYVGYNKNFPEFQFYYSMVYELDGRKVLQRENFTNEIIAEFLETAKNMSTEYMLAQHSSY